MKSDVKARLHERIHNITDSALGAADRLEDAIGARDSAGLTFYVVVVAVIIALMVAVLCVLVCSVAASIEEVRDRWKLKLSAANRGTGFEKLPLFTARVGRR